MVTGGRFPMLTGGRFPLIAWTLEVLNISLRRFRLIFAYGICSRFCRFDLNDKLYYIIPRMDSLN